MVERLLCRIDFEISSGSRCGWMDVVKNKILACIIYSTREGMRSDFYLHRGFIGWSGIGRAPEAMYFTYIICIYKENALLQCFYYFIVELLLIWELYYAIFLGGFLDYVYEART